MKTNPTFATFLLVAATTISSEAAHRLLPNPAQPGAAFGTAVALRNGLAAVGAPRELDASGTRQAGAVYVATADGSLAWRLTPSDAAARYQFGRALALDGDTLVIGAWYAAYVFRYDAATSQWFEEARLEQSCSQGKFGASVALSGDRLLIGSPHIGCLGGSTKGHVFFYRHTGGGVWQLERRFGGDIPATGDYFGWSVALEGDLAVVGSPYSARVNLYRHTGTAWVEDGTLRYPFSQTSSGFGWDVALRDGRLLVGAPSDNTRQSGAGGAFVYRRDGTSWVFEAGLLPPSTSPAQKLTGSYYGTSVALSGDLLAMGGPQADATRQQDGAVVVFGRHNGSWTLITTLTAAPLAGSYDALGTALDLDGPSLLAGAPGHDGAGLDVGAAYLFPVVNEPPPPPPPPPPPNDPPKASFTVVTDGLTAHFDASASYDPDGIIADYSWTFGDKTGGKGVLISHTYAVPDLYTVYLRVTDNGGKVHTVSALVPISDGSGIVLTAHGTKFQGGLQRAHLAWSNAASAHVEVFRDGLRIATVPNNGKYTDPIDRRGRGTYIYRVCEPGAQACSNPATVVFD
ncbi:MAG: PKD domain-containing protein [Verrucomicrobiae bacterium]|nr:PKD domain-containing protein [Verrucomicrobiae bacterium]